MWRELISYVVSLRVICGERSCHMWRACKQIPVAEVSGLRGKLCILAMSGAGRPLSQSIFQLISVKGVKKFPFGFVRWHKNSIFAENF